MTDDIYDYFSGNAPKKVEPIEDDDLDPVEVASDDPESATESVGERSENANPLAGEPAAVVSEAAEPAPAFETRPEPASAAPQAKSDSVQETGHWDFLASELGIKTESPSPAVTEPATPVSSSVNDEAESNSSPAIVPEEIAGTVSKDQEQEVTEIRFESAQAETTDFFGFDPIPSPEDDSVLSTLFTPVDDAPPFEGPADADEASDAGDEIDSDDDYLEFEVEDLDDSPYEDGEEEAFGRRSRRRKPPESQDADEEVRGRSQNRKKAESRRQPERHAKRDESKAVERDERPSRRSGSRGRGRGRSPEKERPVESAAAKPEVFVDEIGWEVPIESKADTSLPQDPPQDSIDSELKEDDVKKSRPPRRRRRRGGKTNDTPVSEHPSEPEFDEIDVTTTKCRLTRVMHLTRNLKKQNPLDVVEAEAGDLRDDGPRERNQPTMTKNCPTSDPSFRLGKRPFPV